MTIVFTGARWWWPILAGAVGLLLVLDTVREMRSWSMTIKRYPEEAVFGVYSGRRS